MGKRKGPEITEPSGLQRKAETRDRRFIDQDDPNVERSRRVLRGTTKVGHENRRMVHSKKLQDLGFRFPSELFSSYGIRMLLQKLGNMRAVDIPDLLTHGLHLSLDDALVKDYHHVRDIRNRIAHGDPVSLSMKELSQKNAILRDLAYAVDRHLNKHFMLSEGAVNNS